MTEAITIRPHVPSARPSEVCPSSSGACWRAPVSELDARHDFFFNPDVRPSHGSEGRLLGLIARRGIPWQTLITEPARSGVKNDRLYRVPNAISERNFRSTGPGGSLRCEWLGAADRDVTLVGVVGRFSPQKGSDLFLRAFARAVTLAPTLRSVMVGDGPLLEECRCLAGQPAIADQVVFTGFRSDLASIYEALDMLPGVPVVSTRDGQTALPVPIEDEPALAQAMVRLADHKPLPDPDSGWD